MGMSRVAGFALLLAAAGPVFAFKSMANWKVPSMKDFKDRKVAAAKFGAAPGISKEFITSPSWRMKGSADSSGSRGGECCMCARETGDKKLVVITGTSSGLGRKTARALLRTGQYHVVGAVRDLEKMEAVAEIEEFDLDNFTPMHVELNSFESVRNFCEELSEFKAAKPIDRLICNAGVYQ